MPCLQHSDLRSTEETPNVKGKNVCIRAPGSFVKCSQYLVGRGGVRESKRKKCTANSKATKASMIKETKAPWFRKFPLSAANGGPNPAHQVAGGGALARNGQVSTSRAEVGVLGNETLSLGLSARTRFHRQGGAGGGN